MNKKEIIEFVLIDGKLYISLENANKSIDIMKKRIEKQKEVIDKIKTNIKNDMEGFMSINEHGEGAAMYDLLEIYLEILENKEVSE